MCEKNVRRVAAMPDCISSYPEIVTGMCADRQPSGNAMIDQPHLLSFDRPQIELDTGLPTWTKVQRHTSGLNCVRASTTAGM